MFGLVQWESWLEQPEMTRGNKEGQSSFSWLELLELAIGATVSFGRQCLEFAREDRVGQSIQIHVVWLELARADRDS